MDIDEVFSNLILGTPVACAAEMERGQPIAGAVVGLLIAGQSRISTTATDENGGFSFADVPPGTKYFV